MHIEAVYCFFVIINLFNILGQEYQETMLFYFLPVNLRLPSLSLH